MAASQKDLKNNCTVLSETDDSHVKKVTPFQTKKKEMADDLSFKGSAIDSAREKWTAKQRAAQPGKGQSVKAI